MLEPLRPEEWALSIEQRFELQKMKLQFEQMSPEQLQSTLALAAEQNMVYHNMVKAMTRKNMEIEVAFKPQQG